MRFPISLYYSMTTYVLGKKLKGDDHYPLVLMLEPTHRCNLNCEGCGRIMEYRETLNKEMTLAECLQSVDEAAAPVVTITGGEPLLYGRIEELVEAVLERGKHIYFCTNGQLLEEFVDRFRPHPRFNWNLHFDGTESLHDHFIRKPGGFRKAFAGMRAAKARGYRVTTNTTIYVDSDLDDIYKLFTQLAEAGVDGMLLAPGFSYEDVDDKTIFLNREEVQRKFREIRRWTREFPIISNPIYLEFLAGERRLQCTPWGNPTRNPRGWKSPCYLITDDHYPTFRDMMVNTDWDHYASGADPRCAQCMVHCGFEPTVVRRMGIKEMLTMVRWNLHA
jgi:hopanoid biosynthesis associated radical SAM protein HpnH